MIQPIGKTRQAEVIRHSLDYLRLAEDVFERRFEDPLIEFDLSGACAGMFKQRGKTTWIRYNPWIFAKYPEDSLANTVPHEVAHYVVHQVFGHLGVKPHGREWQLLMEAFDAEPRVTGRYDLEGIPQRRHKRFEYSCECEEAHQLSTRRHNAIQAGKSRYLCRVCHSELALATSAAHPE